MKHFLGFTYDGIPSMHYGIMQVNVGGGLYDDTLMSSTTIESDTVKGRDVSFFKNICKPLTLLYCDFTFFVFKIFNIICESLNTLR